MTKADAAEGALSSGPTGGIAGYISDADGNPVMGAHIKLSHAGFSRHWTTKGLTGRSGRS